MSAETEARHTMSFDDTLKAERALVRLLGSASLIHTVGQVLEHGELGRSPESGCFVLADDIEDQVEVLWGLIWPGESPHTVKRPAP